MKLHGKREGINLYSFLAKLKLKGDLVEITNSLTTDGNPIKYILFVKKPVRLQNVGKPEISL